MIAGGWGESSGEGGIGESGSGRGDVKATLGRER